VGRSFVEKLLMEGYEINVLDNLRSGNIKFIKKFENHKKFNFYKEDLLKLNKLDFLKFKTIFHFAANPDVQKSFENAEEHFKQNVVATFNLLEATKRGDLKNLIFLSSSTVYGDAKKIPTPEEYPLEPVSLYGASKAACEALISSYAHSFGFNATILRLANIIGINNTHSVIFDFITKLKQNLHMLKVLGDGKQSKSFLHISDCIKAILIGALHSRNHVEYLNIGSEDQVDVNTIAKIVIKHMSLTNTKIEFTGGVNGGRGWKGDVKNMQLDITKLKSFGWKPTYNGLESIEFVTKDFLQNWDNKEI